MMPTEREEIMGEALPRIQAAFTDAMKLAATWRMLFGVFETVKHDPAKGRSRLVKVTPEAITVAKMPEGSTATLSLGTVIGVVEVRTIPVLDGPEAKPVHNWDPNIDYHDWATRAAFSAGVVLFQQIEPYLNTKQTRSVTLATLPAEIGLARESLHRLALDLVVSEHAWN